MAADSMSRVCRIPIPMAALLVLAPACYPETESADSTGGDGSGENSGGGTRDDDTGIISRPDTGGGGGGRPDTGGTDETNGGGGSDAGSFDTGGFDTGGGGRPDSGGSTTLTGVERLAALLCNENLACGALVSTYYTTIDECIGRVSGNIREDIDDSDPACRSAVEQYVDCFVVEGDCTPDYYDQFLLSEGECAVEVEALVDSCGLGGY
jgi:hypothetical protein